MKWLVWLLLISSNYAYPSMEKSYEEGKDYAQALHNSAKQAVAANNAQNVPGFVTDNPAEAGLYEHGGNLEEQTQPALAASDVGQYLKETAKTRQRFVIDPKTDPLFKPHSPDPSLEIQDENEKEGVQVDGVVEKTCEEGGEDISYACLENRHVVPQVPMKTVTLTVNHLDFSREMESYSVQTRGGSFFHHSKSETYQRQKSWTITLPKEINAFKKQFCKGFVARDIKTGEVFNIDCARIQGFKVNQGVASETNQVVNVVVPSFTMGDLGHFLFLRRQVRLPLAASINITLKHDTYEGEAIDEWTGCDHFEQMVDQGLCQYGGERTLTIGAETRNVSGYQITKDAWQYRQIYHCKMVKDECSALRAQGCVQVGSKCQEWREGKCWIYQQKYNCPNGKLSLSKTKPPGSGAFCLTGNCHDTSYQANGEMLEVISRLSMLKEVQDDIQAQKNSSDFKIFKGENYKCSRNCVNFKDCCGGKKGWGVKIHLAGCKPAEEQLAKMRQKNLCYQVGNTYCSKKVLGKCVSKKTSFCCFATKFAKILQVQGRPQLGLGWGDAKCPDCRALTIAELSKVNLSKMDFRELFTDVMKKYKAPNLDLLKEVTSKKITENMKQIEDSLTTKTATVKRGVVSDQKDSL